MIKLPPCEQSLCTLNQCDQLAEFLFDIWPLTAMKFAQCQKRKPEAGSTFCQIQNTVSKNSHKLLI